MKRSTEVQAGGTPVPADIGILLKQQAVMRASTPQAKAARIPQIMLLILLPPFAVWWSKVPLYNPVGYLDPWFYTGYFNNLLELYQRWGSTYYLSRLPWVLPGYAAYHLLAPKVAYFVLHGAFIYVAEISAYLLLKLYYGGSLAFVGSALLVANPLILMAYVWEYPNGAAISYLLAGMYVLNRARWSRRPTALFAAAGALLSSAVICNFFVGLIVASYLVAYFCAKRLTHSEILRQLSLVGVGALICAAMLSFLNHWIIGGSYLFFMAQLLATKGLLASGQLWKYKKPLGQLVKAYYRVAVPVLLLMMSAISFIVHRQAKQQLEKEERVSDLKTNTIFVLLMFAAILGWELIGQGFAISVSYFYVYLVPGIVLLSISLLGFWLRSSSETSESRHKEILLAGVLVCTVFATLVLLRSSELLQAAIQLSLPYLTGVAVVVLVVVGKSSLRSVLACLLVLSVNSSFALSPDVYGYFGGDQAINEGFHLGGIELVRQLHPIIHPNQRVLFWFRFFPSTGAGVEFESVTSLYLWEGSRLGNRMPSLDSTGLQKIRKMGPGFIVTLAREPDRFEMAVESLTKNGFPPQIVLKSSITEGSVTFYYWVLRVGDSTLLGPNRSQGSPPIRTAQ
ncbi:MAG: hypothetical protein ACM3PW_18580 [Chlamydiota bacterium]